MTCGTRSQILGHISARARACMIRDISAFFRTLFGLLFAIFGLLHTFLGCEHISERILGSSEEFGTHLGLLSFFGSNQFSTFFGTHFSLTRSTNRLILSRLLLSSLCPSLHRSPAPCRIDCLNQPHAIRIRRHAPCSLLMIE